MSILLVGNPVAWVVAIVLCAVGREFLGQLVLAGAPAKALELGGDAGKSPRLAFLAALSLGDLERATSLARREDATPSCPET